MTSKMKLCLGTMTFLVAATIVSAQSTANRMGSPDNTWMTKAAQGGMAEVELGKLAQTNASSDAVKQFGQRMVDDHTKAGEELARIAADKGITLPTGLDAKDQATKDSPLQADRQRVRSRLHARHGQGPSYGRGRVQERSG